jgi:hypothetical protein
MPTGTIPCTPQAGSPLMDLTYFLLVGLSPDDMRLHRSQVMQAYLAGLGAAGVGPAQGAPTLAQCEAALPLGLAYTATMMVLGVGLGAFDKEDTREAWPGILDRLQQQIQLLAPMNALGWDEPA